MAPPWTVRIDAQAGHTLSLFHAEAVSEYIASPQAPPTPKLVAYYCLNKLLTEELVSDPRGNSYPTNANIGVFNIRYKDEFGWRVILYIDPPDDVYVRYLHRIENASFASISVSDTIAKM